MFILPFIAYLIGSISSAVVVSRLMRLPDPRSAGSNNPGATNLLRLGGKKAAAITLVGDLLKGLLPVVGVRLVVDDSLTEHSLLLGLVGLAAFLGHLYPVFFNFRGGKGAATAAGVFAGLSGWLVGGLVVVWLLVAVGTRYSSVASLTAAVAAPLWVYFLLGDRWLVLMAGVMAVWLFWRHRSNIGRLLTGEESRLGG